MKVDSKSTFSDLIEKGTIVQAILTLGIVGVALYMFAIGKEVPPTLIQWAAFMIGLYGGARIACLTKRSI